MVHCGKGATHDFKLFKDSRLKLQEDTLLLADLGYLGIEKQHSFSSIPYKNSKNKKLTEAQKESNRSQSKTRVLVENIIRRCKIFRILKEQYRGKRKNFAKHWQVVARLTNLRYGNLSFI